MIDNYDELVEFGRDKDILLPSKIKEIKNYPITIHFNEKEIAALYSSFKGDNETIDYTEHMKLKKLQEILN